MCRVVVVVELFPNQIKTLIYKLLSPELHNFGLDKIDTWYRNDERIIYLS